MQDLRLRGGNERSHESHTSGLRSVCTASQTRMVPSGSHSKLRKRISRGYTYDTPSQVISTLEALGVLVALKLKCGEDPLVHSSRITIAPTVTYKRDNGAALNKLMASKYPSSAILMEMSAFMKRMGINAKVDGLPEGESASRCIGNWVL